MYHFGQQGDVSMAQLAFDFFLDLFQGRVLLDLGRDGWGEGHHPHTLPAKNEKATSRSDSAPQDRGGRTRKIFTTGLRRVVFKN